MINTSFSPAVSSLVFFVVVVVLLSIIYRKDPQCCKLRSYQGQHVVSPQRKKKGRKWLLCWIFFFKVTVQLLKERERGPCSKTLWPPSVAALRSVRFNLHGCGKRTRINSIWSLSFASVKLASLQRSLSAWVTLMALDGIHTYWYFILILMLVQHQCNEIITNQILFLTLA